MDDNQKDKKDLPAGRQDEEFGDPELNNEPETPIIPAPEPEEPTPSYSSPLTTPRKRNPKKLLYLVGAVILILVLFNAFRMLTGGSKTSAPSPTPTPVAFETPTPEPTIEATVTPEPTTSSVDQATGLDRADLDVEVQNGSGEAGVGKTAADLLKKLGYSITATGNADNFDYTDVTVKVKASQKKYLPLLIKDLSTNYTIGSSSSDLSASSSADALVIIGK